MHILVLNVGSSSIKFQLIETDAAAIAARRDCWLARGHTVSATLVLEARDRAPVTRTIPLSDPATAVEAIVDWLAAPDSGVPIASARDIGAVGHRLVHGGERFIQSVRVDDTVLRQLEALVELAPLHNPYGVRGITAAQSVLGADVPQVAVFDTAFHHTLPETSYLYALPYEYYRRHGVRRYGFHGTSHRYLAARYRAVTGKERFKIVTIHLGNGASACAIVDGASVDTSMGFTPLEGLVMGTRSGDLDPAILGFLAEKEGLAVTEVDRLLNERSGLLGLSGGTADMRTLLARASGFADASQDETLNTDSADVVRRARLAIDVFCYRAKKYLGAYLAALNGADAVVFAGGIGENAAAIRSRICAGLDWLGIAVDDVRNVALVGTEGRFDRDGSRVALWVIPTNEELVIARDTWRLVSGGS